MKYNDGLNCLDKLRDYVQDSLSIRQKFNSEHFQPMVDPLSFRVKAEETKKDESNEEFNLLYLVKAELSDEGKFSLRKSMCNLYAKILSFLSVRVFPNITKKVYSSDSSKQRSHCIYGGCIVNAPLNLPKMQCLL